MKCQRQISKSFGRTTGPHTKVASWTAPCALPSVIESIIRRRNSVFGHIARLAKDVHVPAHQDLQFLPLLASFKVLFSHVLCPTLHSFVLLLYAVLRIFTGRCRATLLCGLHLEWELYDFAPGDIGMSNWATPFCRVAFAVLSAIVIGMLCAF